MGLNVLLLIIGVAIGAALVNFMRFGPPSGCNQDCRQGRDCKCKNNL